jgi:hypothetical protein
MMIKVTLGTTLKRVTPDPMVLSSRSLRSVLEEFGIDYSTGTMHLDGAPLGPGDLDKTFEDFGITEKCYLLNVVKADNA